MGSGSGRPKGDLGTTAAVEHTIRTGTRRATWVSATNGGDAVGGSVRLDGDPGGLSVSDDSHDRIRGELYRIVTND